jgi:hypothetical protein
MCNDDAYISEAKNMCNDAYISEAKNMCNDDAYISLSLPFYAMMITCIIIELGYELC